MGDEFLSAYPKITDYSWQKRRDYLVLVASVAMADQKLHPEEKQLLDQWMDEFQLSPKGREAVRVVLRRRKADIAAIEKRLAKTDLVYSVMLDMMGMAMADGVLMDDEIYMLRAVADQLDIDPIDFNILIEFVHSAHQAASLISPEPLYEHNIDSAFALLRKRKVSLFPHTLLCVSSQSFDQQLKARWAKFLRKSGQRKRR